MDSILITGPAKLKGEVRISGAKNAALPILAATIMAEGEFVIRNIPEVSDVWTMLKILKSLGAKASFEKNTFKIDTRTINKNEADYNQVSKMRASVCLLGPLLARFGTARVSMPGGCVIGPRPIDLHLKGLRALGASIELDHGYVVAKAKRLKGGHVYLGGAFGSSVLATANIMVAATTASGKTVIECAACEPEIVDLGNFLIRMGARIRGLGSPRIEVDGVEKLAPCGYTIISDRIEAGTYIIAASMMRGDVLVRNMQPGNLGALLDKLQEAGVHMTIKKDTVHVKPRRNLKPVSVTTLVYPGFPTDLQAQMTALMCVTPGISVITEKIFPERFMHVSELNRMGAKIQLEGNSAIISGTDRLSAAPVMASDLRASAALILAGLAAKGETELSRVYHLDRGYERLVEKFRELGADIKRKKQ